MKISEEKILARIKNELDNQKEKEKNYYINLKAPEYHKPKFRFWWVFAPLATIAIALVILVITPAKNHYPTIATIDNQLFEVESDITLLSDPKSNSIDTQLENLDETINFLKEEKL